MKEKILAPALFFAVIPFLMFMPFQPAVAFEAADTGKVLAYIPLHEKERTFHIQYTHSIHLSDVKESYTVMDDGMIRQVELMYDETAIGMPSNAEGSETFEMKDGHFFIRNMKRDFPSIYLRTGQVVADHKIITDHAAVPLSAITKPGSLVKIQSRTISLWQKWRGVKIDG